MITNERELRILEDVEKALQKLIEEAWVEDALPYKHLVELTSQFRGVIQSAKETRD